MTDKEKVEAIIRYAGKCVSFRDFNCPECPVKVQCNINSSKVIPVGEKIKTRIETAKAKLAEIELEEALFDVH